MFVIFNCRCVFFRKGIVLISFFWLLKLMKVLKLSVVRLLKCSVDVVVDFVMIDLF